MQKDFNLEEAWKKIRGFAFDVDGVLTDGGVFADSNDDLYRVFDSKDGFGFRMASMHGYHLAIITGGRSKSIMHRFLRLGVPKEDIYLRSRDKMKDFNDFCSRHGLAPDEVLYMGDDVPDISVMQACGIGACPADSVQEAIDAADYVSPRPGGHQCAREVIEKVLKLNGDWTLDVELYEKKF